MTDTLMIAPDPWNRPGKPTDKRHQALMLGASALFHLALFGPMILLAVGEEYRPRQLNEPPAIQLELDPALQPERIQPPRLIPEPLPRVEPLPPIPVPTPDQDVLPEPDRRVDLQQPAPLSQPTDATRPLPEVTPIPPRDSAQIDQIAPRDAPSQIITTVPSLRPNPASETLTPSQSVAPPSAFNRTLPSVVQTPAQPDAGTAADSREQDSLARRRLEDEDAANSRPSAPSPRLASPAPGALPPSAGQSSTVPGVSGAWRVAPSSQLDRNARALRTSPLGCRVRERLTASEQALCDERFNADAAVGAQNPIRGSGNAERDARFAREGARELRNYEAMRRPLSGGTGNVAPADCPGSNFGTGCAGSLLDPSMQMDSSSNVRTNRRDGPRPAGRPMTPGSAGAAGRPGNGSD